MGFQEFSRLASNRFKFGLFMLAKLPSAFICGVRLRSIQPHQAVVSVPFKWLSQNPFRSIYFACQAMAAEMSTGVLVLGHIHGVKPAISTLVLKIEGSFTKKADTRIYFTCNQGDAINKAIVEAINSGSPTQVTIKSVGLTAAGHQVSEFLITWGFKVKSIS